MQKITPHLWFDTHAVQAAEFYTSIFPNSTVTSVTTLPGTPGGDTDVVAFVLSGHAFAAISAGPLFRFNPSISFLVACDTAGEVQGLWDRLIEGGRALMPLDAYPFSERYGWLEDRYGLSWQLMPTGSRAFPQKIIPTLLFTGAVSGKAEDAIRFYTSVFSETGVGEIHRYGRDEAPEREGTVKHAPFALEGQQFAAMDSARDRGFSFNEAISLMVYCDTQQEIDDFWGRLSAVPEAEQCGWLKDRYGVSWQVVPREMEAMIRRGSPDEIARVTEAFLTMKKFDLAALRAAYAGR